MSELSKPPNLPLYENARKALAELRSIDEVKNIVNKAAAAQEYARRAKDSELVERATEYREFAERRVGEILIEMRQNRERTSGYEGAPKKPKQSENISEKKESPKITPTKPKLVSSQSEKPKQPTKLSDIGVTKHQSSSWQQKAKIPENEFVAHVEAAKQKEKEKITKEKNKEFEVRTENKTYILSIDNELENRLEAVARYLEKNIKEIEEIVNSKEYLQFSTTRDYSTRFFLLGQKILKFAEELRLPKLVKS